MNGETQLSDVRLISRSLADAISGMEIKKITAVKPRSWCRRNSFHLKAFRREITALVPFWILSRSVRSHFCVSLGIVISEQTNIFLLVSWEIMRDEKLKFAMWLRIVNRRWLFVIDFLDSSEESTIMRPYQAPRKNPIRQIISYRRNERLAYHFSESRETLFNR